MSSRVDVDRLERARRRRARAPSRNSMAPSMRHAGTIFFTCLTTKLTIQRFGAGSMSPTCVVIDVLDRRLREHLLQRAGEILEDDDRLGAGVLQLVLELARRVQRIDVDHRHAGAQDAEQRHRVLQQVGRHDGDAIALGHARQPLQERGEVARLPRRARHSSSCGRGCDTPACRRTWRAMLVEQVRDRCELVGIDLRGHAGRIVLEPDSCAHGVLRSPQLTRSRRSLGEDALSARHAANRRDIPATPKPPPDGFSL